MARSRVELRVATATEFMERSLGRARALDRGEQLPAGITISFEDPLEMLTILSAERVRLLKQVKEQTQQISALATSLKRDARAVSRDVSVLEKAGLVRTSYETNPGHGRRKIVEPVAREFKLVANI